MFAGKIPEQEKETHYCLADAYLMPSYGEGSSKQVLNVLAVGSELTMGISYAVYHSKSGSKNIG
jgi:hypothetical protein